MYGDFWMPAGYPMFLWLLRQVSSQLWFTIWIQHLLGLGTGTFLYLSMRRLGVVRAIACIPAAIPLLSGDHLYLEHTVMADHLTIFLTAGGIWAAICGLVPKLHLRWLAIASALLAMAALTRSVGVVLLPILVLCTALWVKESFRTRCAAVAAALLPGDGCLCSLCRRILPRPWPIPRFNRHERLESLRACRAICRLREIRSSRKELRSYVKNARHQIGPRHLATFGIWNRVPRKRFELGPKTGRKLGEFAKRAIVHQPGEYAG